MRLQDALTAARWNNEIQAFAEALPHGIPVNISSAPRNGAAVDGKRVPMVEGKTEYRVEVTVYRIPAPFL